MSNIGEGFPVRAAIGVQKNTQGFLLMGFPSSGFPSTGLPTSGFSSFPALDMDLQGFDSELELESSGVESEGFVPKKVKYLEGTTKLTKGDTKYAWKEFGGDALAVEELDGSSYVTRIVERESKKSGAYFKLVEKLTRDTSGYGVVTWRLEIGAIARRKPPKTEFDVNWKDAILAKVREVVMDGTSVGTAAKALAAELGVSFGTIRANIWVANKWANGEGTTFLPHRSMIQPIYELLCDLGKKDKVLASMEAYSKEVAKPSKYVMDILISNRCMEVKPGCI